MMSVNSWKDGKVHARNSKSVRYGKLRLSEIEPRGPKPYSIHEKHREVKDTKDTKRGSISSGWTMELTFLSAALRHPVGLPG